MSCGSSTGPLVNGATNAPIEPLVASTLPMVRSTSLTRIPGELNLPPSCILRSQEYFSEIIY